MPSPSFDERTRVSWAGQEMSGHQNPVSGVLTLRGFPRTARRNVSKCKSNLMSSPLHNLIASTHERTSAPVKLEWKNDYKLPVPKEWQDQYLQEGNNAYSVPIEQNYTHTHKYDSRYRSYTHFIQEVWIAKLQIVDVIISIYVNQALNRFLHIFLQYRFWLWGIWKSLLPHCQHIHMQSTRGAFCP